ncbi:hypothetical protein [Bythopirellula polymerisocia]|uniref:DUF3352 domain-containing protein n=1 Tax=Bythopirellula polymerisocia TaxID=2528003 RepID=A0A5C6CUV8_9BACT|nr:hypothetical protein [Bythopirellula polymerisocia]TWU28332.1 hypothetical protein Pla144_16200 [Bythopirellula polymerisocia]
MKALTLTLALSFLIVAPWAYAQQTAVEVDLHRIAPQDAHLAVYAKHNPERDYQQPLFANVWNKFKAEKLDERLLEIITSRMSEEDLTKAQDVIDEFRAALEPVLNETDWVCEEVVVAQIMQFPSNQTVVAMRIPLGSAEKLETSFKNLLGLVEKYSEGKVPLVTSQFGDTQITVLGLPAEIHFQPSFARIDDIVFFSTTEALLTNALAALKDETTVSKFDDPRLIEALKHLPTPEDSLTFFDGQQLFKQLRGLGDFVKQQAGAKGNGEKLERFKQIFNLVMDEISILDYEIAVETTDGHENRTIALGRYPEGAENTLLGKLALGGKPFEDWQSWIPADAAGYSLSSGVRLHPAYEQLMGILHTQFPETHEALQKFQEVQDKIDLHLDKDLFQSFSGESVSVTLPNKEGGQENFSAIRCTNPDRIRELLHRLVDKLGQIPAMESQKLALVETEGLEGFETINASILQAFNLKPVIGFHEGWLMVGSNASSIERVLAARAGTAERIGSNEHIARFHLPLQEAVQSLSYTDLNASIHQGADIIRKVGGIAPMFIGMAAANANADTDQLKPVAELIALLPSVASVVEEFDFYDANLTTVTEGPMPRTYLKQSVTLIQVPETTSADD